MEPSADNKEYWQIIWEKFRAGDRGAFETIYCEFIDVLFSYGSRITSDRPLLEDSIQDLFIDIYTYGTGLRKPESLEYYLFKTLKRIIYRKLKEKHRFTHPDQLVEHFDLKFPLEESKENITDEQLQKLQSELINLDAKKRELLFLKFNSGLTYKEMGKLLNMKPDAVKKQVYRLLNNIRGKLGKMYLELSVFCFRK